MNVLSLYGYKIGQTQGYTAQGYRVPLTQIKAENWVVATKSNKVTLALGSKKNLSQPLLGLVKHLEEKIHPRHFREIPATESDKNLVTGQKLTVDQVFGVGDKVKVTGTIIGKGFQGVVRRHGFKGGPKTHGQSDRQRHPGSIGQTTTPGRVYKGKRMAGHMGTTTVTVKGLEVFAVQPEESLLVISGLVPGAKNGLVKVTKVEKNA